MSEVIAKQSFIERALDVVRDPNPILVKELQTTLRTKLFIRFLYVSTFILNMVVLGIGILMAMGVPTPATVGQAIFQTFFALVSAVLTLLIPAYASTAITSERETNTFESLVLSGMDASRIVWGKFAAISASVALILVAYSPSAGIPFLFGGVSPLEVITGFFAAGLTLSISVSLGIAISARLQTTRIAILIAAVVSWIFGPIIWGFVTGGGEIANEVFNIEFHGPFWFASGFANRFFEITSWVFFLGLPAFVTFMLVWFFLASAIAGLRPEAEDRSTPFKVWGLIGLVGTLSFHLAAMCVVAVDDLPEYALATSWFFTAFAMAISLVYIGDSVTTPRLVQIRRADYGPLKKLFSVFGSGLAPSLRFTIAWLIVGHIGFYGISSLVPVMRGYTKATQEFEVALIVMVFGNCALAIAFAAFGAWMTSLIRIGLAGRVLALVGLSVATLAPVLIQSVVDPQWTNKLGEAPAIVLFSPISPSFLAIEVWDDKDLMLGALVVLPALVFLGFGLIFTVLTEMKCRRENKRERERMDAHLARVAAAQGFEGHRPSQAPPAPTQGPPRSSRPFPEAQPSHAPNNDRPFPEAQPSHAPSSSRPFPEAAAAGVAPASAAESSASAAPAQAPPTSEGPFPSGTSTPEDGSNA